MRILLITAMVFLPALVMAKDAATAVNFQPICDFHNREIERLERNVMELVKDVVMESDLYAKLKNSSNICGVIGYLALPECATKEGLNVFDKLDDKCAETKTNGIVNSLQKLLRLDTRPSGQAIFRSCKDIVVKQLLGQFEKMLELISSLCDQSPSTSTRRKRSYGGGSYPGGYDPSTIWFQYMLCHEQKITCYFFTDGWKENQYGQYYLYQNLFDTDFDSIGHASTGEVDDLLALALLSGAGGSQQYYPHQGYPSYKKRRDTNEVEVDLPCDDDVVTSGGRRRRSPAEATATTKSPVKTTAASNGGDKKGGKKEKKKNKKKTTTAIECLGDC